MHVRYIFILKLFYLFKKRSNPTLLTSMGSQSPGLRDIRISSFSLFLLPLVPRCPVSPSGRTQSEACCRQALWARGSERPIFTLWFHVMDVFTDFQPSSQRGKCDKDWLTNKYVIFFRSDQIRSVAQSCPTLCNPMNRSTPGLPVHHQLPEFTQTHVHRVSDAIQPSHPLSSPSPLAPSPSQHQSLSQWVNSSHEVAKVLEFQL